MGKIVLISGGTSSGKSKFAEDYCSKIVGKTAYIATSLIFDKDMEIKKEKHVKRREFKNWDTIEEHTNIGNIINDEFDYDVVLIDCITMYITNLMFDSDKDFDAKNIYEREIKRKYIIANIENMIASICSHVSKKNTYFVMVTNEVGMGIIPGNELSRFFAEISGEVNQIISDISDEVYLTVSGIPVKLK